MALKKGVTQKWWLKPIRMMRRDYIGAFDRFIESDLDALARESRERWHINCEWVMATPGCAPGTAHQTLFNSAAFEKFPGVGDADLLRAYLPHARKHDVRLLAYINQHWFSYAFAETHPGWEQLLEDGTPYGRKHPLYGNGTTMCVNSAWRDWAFEMIREVVRTGVDGCFLDGPVVYPGGCYCSSCRERFAAQHGGDDLPEWNDWADPGWKRFLDFRAQSWADYIRDAQAAALEINPDAVIFLNGGHYDSSSMALARDAHRMEPFQSFNGSEHFYHCTSDFDSPYKSLNLARFLSAGEKPAVVFTHHTLSTWHYVPLPKAEMASALAQTVAGGANTFFAIFMDAMKTRSAEAFESVNLCEFLARHEDYYTATRPAAETAVLFSNRTLYTYITRHRELSRDTGSGVEKNLILDAGSQQLRQDLASLRAASAEVIDGENPGCLDALNYGHVPVRVLWDEHLTAAKLKGVKTLILPTAACLSAAQIRAIRAFVEAGGGLVATFESGMYNEWGDTVRRPQWLKFLGIRKVAGAWLPSRTEEYVTIVTERLAGFPKGVMIPRPLNGLKVMPTADAEALAFFHEAHGKSYESLKGLSEHPALLYAKRGKGRVVYVASPLFESFDRFHIADHQALARAAVELAAGRSGLQVQTDALGSVAVEVRAQPGRLLVHLVNVTGEMKRPMEQILPVRDIALSVRSRSVTRVKALRSGKTLPFTAARGRVSVRLPVIEDYEVLVFERR